MISWKYIDKNAATIAAIRDYDCMRGIAANTSDEIKELYQKMVAPRSQALTGMPLNPNPFAGQNKLVGQLDEVDMLTERYAAAISYLRWFEPAWLSIQETDRTILREFYMGGNLKSGATYRLMEELGKSESHVERMRSKALQQLKNMLYG